jgi:hypothetical protein
MLTPYLNPVRIETLGKVLGRQDLVRQMGLNPHDGSRFRAQLDRNLKGIMRLVQVIPNDKKEDSTASPSVVQSSERNAEMSTIASFAPCAADLAIPSPLPLCGADRARVLRLRARTVPQVCFDAAVRCRVTGGPIPHLVLWDSPFHGYTVDEDGMSFYAVSKAGLPQRKQQRAMKILEVLAYGFMDYTARESVCGRGFFICQVTPESGRLWLSEIGRKGGSSRSKAKVEASIRNGRKRSVSGKD